MLFIIVFVLQVLFNIFKVFEIKYAYENNLKGLLITGGILSIINILGIYFSVGSLLSGNWKVVIVFVLGSLTGKYLSYVLNTEKYRAKVYELLNTKQNESEKITN